MMQYFNRDVHIIRYLRITAFQRNEQLIPILQTTRQGISVAHLQPLSLVVTLLWVEQLNICFHVYLDEF